MKLTDTSPGRRLGVHRHRPHPTAVRRALLPRLRRGDVAVLDQVDLDGPTAQALVDAGVAAVVNAAR